VCRLRPSTRFGGWQTSQRSIVNLPFHVNLSSLSFLVGCSSIQASTDLSESLSDPNPIGALYPLSLTGTTNGTIALLPIPLDLARSIIPRKWSLRHEAIQKVLPRFAVSMYPVCVSDHSYIN
jgi:hypothetical protein